MNWFRPGIAITAALVIGFAAGTDLVPIVAPAQAQTFKDGIKNAKKSGKVPLDHFGDGGEGVMETLQGVGDEKTDPSENIEDLDRYFDNRTNIPEDAEEAVKSQGPWGKVKKLKKAVGAGFSKMKEKINRLVEDDSAFDDAPAKEPSFEEQFREAVESDPQDESGQSYLGRIQEAVKTKASKIKENVGRLVKGGSDFDDTPPEDPIADRDDTAVADPDAADREIDDVIQMHLRAIKSQRMGLEGAYRFVPLGCEGHSDVKACESRYRQALDGLQPSTVKPDPFSEPAPGDRLDPFAEQSGGKGFSIGVTSKAKKAERKQRQKQVLKGYKAREEAKKEAERPAAATAASASQAPSSKGGTPQKSAAQAEDETQPVAATATQTPSSDDSGSQKSTEKPPSEAEKHPRTGWYWSRKCNAHVWVVFPNPSPQDFHNCGKTRAKTSTAKRTTAPSSLRQTSKPQKRRTVRAPRIVNIAEEERKRRQKKSASRKTAKASRNPPSQSTVRPTGRWIYSQKCKSDVWVTFPNPQFDNCNNTPFRMMRRGGH